MAKIDAFFKLMKEQGASDLHMAVGAQPMLRLRGELTKINFRELSQEDMQGFIYEIMNPGQKKEFDDTHDIDFAYEVPEVARFRANVMLQRKGMTAVFRMIPTKILTCEDLGLPESVKKFAHLKKGLVLVTGATGSGKSTTLAAIIDHVNDSRHDHILTVEDPLEFVHPNKSCLVNQREVGGHTASFARALKAALREDPDVILIGEMRDLETISLAITAAETGHLVFGTLHTSSAAKTVDRIIDAFPTNQQEQIRTMLAESLKGVVAQQLLRTADGKGRCAALEILVGTTALANLIREGKTFQIPSIIQTGKREGMQTMDQAIMDFLKVKKITPQEAYNFAVDKKLFEQYLTPGAAA